MKLLDVVHPAAKTLVDISLSQDAEVSTVEISQCGEQHNNCAHLNCIAGAQVEHSTIPVLGWGEQRNNFEISPMLQKNLNESYSHTPTPHQQ